MKKTLFIAILLFVTSQARTQDKNMQIPYTLADRDRLISVEKEIQSLRNEMTYSINSLRNEMTSSINSLRNEMTSFRNEMNAKLESQQQQIDDLKTMFYTGFGILISLTLFLLGYTIWDRRTALEPLRIQTQTLKEKYHELVLVLKEFSKESPRLAEILKVHGIIL